MNPSGGEDTITADVVPVPAEDALPDMALASYLPTTHEPASLLSERRPHPPTDDPTIRELFQERVRLNSTVWKDERLAQKHEERFVALWDELLSAPNAYTVLEAFPFEEITYGELVDVANLDWGIRVSALTGSEKSVTFSEWPALLDRIAWLGFKVEETEWHHSAFDAATDTAPARSTVAMVIHAAHKSTGERLIVRGDLKVTWSGAVDDSGRPLPGHIDATGVKVIRRRGEVPFDVGRTWEYTIDPSGRSGPTTIHPILVHDLNADGLPEIVIGGYNEVWWNRGHGSFEKEQFLPHFVPRTNAGLLADLDGDAVTDLLLGIKQGPLLFYKGTPAGRFPDKPRIIKAAGHLTVPTSLSCGDVEGDGDLDVWVGQLRPPYVRGKVPQPFYDANDGWPSYLLLNDGQGNFLDGTDLANLTAKRHRRTFSSTFLDLDQDGDQDLVVVSDFCGMDIYFNDGSGRFTDVTDQVAPDNRAFGMSHTFGDYNLDGRLDMYMIGMSSTTARRLDHMQLRREDFAAYADMRKHMGYGNRMLLATADHRYLQAPFNSDVARTGWSWGSTTFDFDNDGDPDAFVTNGQLSGKTTKDYCTDFWCHDIYASTAKEDPNVSKLFDSLAPQLDGHDISWNGYEHDALFMNLNGTDFINVGYLMGVGFEFDGRSTVSGDFDADGRVDLLVEEFRIRDKKSVLHLVRNNWNSSHHWIGFHLREGGKYRSPLGVVATLELGDGQRVAANLAGHSVWSQHPNTIHFGLGQRAEVVSATLRWPNGKTVRLDTPTLNTYHVVEPPALDQTP